MNRPKIELDQFDFGSDRIITSATSDFSKIIGLCSVLVIFVFTLPKSI